jgi:hypothetical protein
MYKNLNPWVCTVGLYVLSSFIRASVINDNNVANIGADIPDNIQNFRRFPVARDNDGDL